jgi:hypothetical protein
VKPASPPATWAWAQGRHARARNFTSPAWNCTPSTRCSPKAAAATSASSSRRSSTARRRDPQTYGIGIKELWEIKPRRARPGWWCTPPAGRWTTAPTAAASSTTSRTTWSRSASSSASTTEPLPVALRGVPALQDAPEIRKHLEGGKRLAYGARAIAKPAACRACRSWSSRAAPDRRRRRLPQRRPHQGQPRRDQVRHAGRRSRLRGARRRARARRARRLSRPPSEDSWLHEELHKRATSSPT